MSKKLSCLLIGLISIFLCLCNTVYLHAAGNETATFGVDSYTSGNDWDIASKKALILDINNLDTNVGGYSIKIIVAKGMKLDSYLWNEAGNTNWTKGENVKGNAIAMDNSTSDFFDGGSISLDSNGNTILVYRVSKGCYHMDLTDKIVVVPDYDYTYGGDEIPNAISYELLDKNNSVLSSGSVNSKIVGDIVSNSSSQMAKTVAGAQNIYLYDLRYYRTWTGMPSGPLPAGTVTLKFGIPEVVSDITNVKAKSSVYSPVSSEQWSFDVDTRTLTINNYEVKEGTGIHLELYGSIKDDAELGIYTDKIDVTNFTYVFAYDNENPSYIYPDNYKGLSSYRVSIVEGQEVIAIKDYSNISYAQSPDGHPFIMGKMSDFYTANQLNTDQNITWSFDDNTLDIVGVFFPIGNASSIKVTSVEFNDGTIITPSDFVKAVSTKLFYINVADIKEYDNTLPESAKYIRSITANCGSFPDAFTTGSWYGRPVGYFSQQVVDQGIKQVIPFYFSVNGKDPQILSITYDPNDEFACLNTHTYSYSDEQRKTEKSSFKAGETVYMRTELSSGGNLYTATYEPSMFIVVPMGVTFDPSKVKAETFSTTTSSNNHYDVVDVTDRITYKTNYVKNTQGEYYQCYQFTVTGASTSTYLNKVGHSNTGTYSSKIGFTYQFDIDETTSTQDLNIGSYIYGGKGDIVSGDFMVMKGTTGYSTFPDAWDFNQNNNRTESNIVASYARESTIIDNMNITVSGYLTHEGVNSAISPYDPGSDGSNEVNVVEFLPDTNADYHVIISNTLISVGDKCSVNAYIPIPNGKINSDKFEPINTDETRKYYQFNDYQWPLALRKMLENPDPDVFDIVYYFDQVEIDNSTGEASGNNYILNPSSLSVDQLKEVVLVEIKSKDDIKIPTGQFEFILPLHVGVSESEATQASLNKSKNIFRPRYHREGGIGAIWVNGNYVAARLAVSSIGGYVFEDENGNGLRDTDEKPIKGFTVELYDSTSQKIAQTKTDEEGKYTFGYNYVQSGDYTLKFINNNEDKVFTKSHTPTKENYKINSDAIVEGNDHSYATSSISIPYSGVLAGYQEYQNAALFTDTVGAGENGDSPDGIPDAYEVKVNYIAENGAVSKDFDYFYKADGHGYSKTFNINITNPAKATPDLGCAFKHWENTFDENTNSDGKFTFTDVEGGREITVKAVFETKNYSITYNGGGDSTDTISDVPAAQIKQHGVNINLSDNVPKRTDKDGKVYTFTGWNTQTDGKGTSYSQGAVYSIDKDLELYAQWGIDVNEYHVIRSFESLSGNDTTETEHSSAQYGDTVEITAKNYPGFEFYRRDTKTLRDYDIDYEPEENNNPLLYIRIPEESNDGIYVTYYYRRLSFTLSFDTDGGDQIDPITKKYGEEISAPDNPKKEGFVFVGWDKDIPETMPSQNMTIKALWQKEYKVVFKDYDGTVLKTVAGIEGKPVEAPSVNERPGYRFTGWSGEIPETIPYEDVELIAQYSQIDYKISYVLNGGTITVGNNPTTFTVEQLPFDLINPVKTGYDFSGWTGTGLSGNTMKVTINSIGDKSFTANWPADATYTVNHYQQNLDGSYPQEPTATETRNGVTGQNTAAHAKTYTGFSAESFDQETIKEDNSTVVEIKYKRNKYTIAWYNDDGTTLLDSTEVVYGSVIPEYKGDTPTKESTAEYDYTFNEWIPDSTIGDTVIGDIVFTASYNNTLRVYTITFVNYDGSELQSSDVEYGTTPKYNGETPTKPKDEQHTYTFSGWEPQISTVSGTATYTATFTNDVNEYEVKWLNDDGSTVLYETKVSYGNPIPEYEGDTPTKESTAEHDYTFNEWISDSPVGDTVTGEINYIASYISSKRKYTITFVNDDNTVLQSSEIEYGTMPTYTGDTPTKTDDDQYSYSFSGWEPQISTVIGAGTYKATFTSQVKPSYHTVVYKDGLGNTLETFNDLLNGTKTPTIDDPTRTGYVFKGWDPALNETVTQDIEYTATWEPIIYTIEFDGNGADSGSVEKIENVKYDSPKELPDNNFIKAGYDFEGWNTSPDGKGTTYMPETKQNLTDKDGATVTLYPIWVKFEYKYTTGNYSSWVKGSSGTLYFVVKRLPKHDDLTFGNFTNELLIDKKPLELNKDYTVDIGSLKQFINSSYLNELDYGPHTINAKFKDGEASTVFYVVKKEDSDKKYSVPRTGIE